MILDLKEAECLKLLGLCRYIPVFLGKRYAGQVLYTDTTKHLLLLGLIKYTADGKCLKLTYFGNSVLRELGYTFSTDARSLNNGSRYIRRMLCAEINMLFHSAGIDIFSEKIKDLNRSEPCYIPFLNMRSAKNGAALSCARFAGIFRNGDTAYIAYYAVDDEIGVHVSFEEGAFKPLAFSLEGVEYIKIIFAGNSLDALWKLLFSKKSKEKCKNQSEHFSQAFQKFAYNVHLFERNKNGTMQAQIIAVPDYRKKLAEYFCVGKTKLPPILGNCDGFHNGRPLIIAIDMELNRICKGIKQANKYSELEPYILCLNFQESFLFKYFQHMGIRKAQILPIGFEKVETGLNLKLKQFASEPARDTKGDYMVIK